MYLPLVGFIVAIEREREERQTVYKFYILLKVDNAGS